MNMQSLQSQVDFLGRLISAADVRQKVISQNIANVNTPNYQRLQVDFEQLLLQEMKKTSGSVGPENQVTPVISQTLGQTSRSDGNNVDIDQEIGELNKNALLQQVYLHLMRTELSEMKMAMTGS
ncbi:MAG: flagellar basal body rod protein FlgB [Planctomycetaceae bacterium]|nr:flagellar basal body rod protein FlgB [Planctomycetaceae bacterium]